jgi:hypothetical protein
MARSVIIIFWFGVWDNDVICGAKEERLALEIIFGGSLKDLVNVMVVSEGNRILELNLSLGFQVSLGSY